MKYDEHTDTFLNPIKKFVTNSKITVYSKRYALEITVPPGFKHDGYTLVPNLKDMIPAIVHDYMYKYKIADNGTVITKKMADNIFYDLMLEYDIKPWIAKLYHFGVKWLGWIGDLVG